ncbi:hypothetical protein AB0D49_32895 [Streptomyces sp. NPDC048290]|uniref:hypothetical protein n=1 Tax=Streptomyces sp. NPDC048290 TaxID=3155811 RepID=UPI003442CB4D
MANYQVRSSPGWVGQIRQIALPDWRGDWDLTPEQEAHVLETLFELFDRFLGERDAAASGE